VILTDLGSKNGTRLNGRSIRSAEVGLGDEIDLGGLCLTLSRLDPDEAHLALVLNASSSLVAPIPGKTTQLSPAKGVGGLEVLACLEEVAQIWQRLFRAPEPDLDGCLRLLMAATGSEGAAVVEDREGVFVLLASHGAVDQVHLDHLDAQDVGETSSTELVWKSLGEAHRLGVALFGGQPGAVRRSLVALVAEWTAHLRQPDLVLSASVAEPDLGLHLVFPEGYVRGASPAMATVYSQLRHLTQGDVPVLIIGATGVGKELLARTLHLSSHRGAGPLVAINCAAIPGELLEAELFGIGRGVATGVSARSGRILEANGGTLFLDEVGDMPADLQAKLLRVLQEKEVEPLGSKPVAVDVRILSATNNELLDLIERGVFRQDLYYRLAGYVLRLPALAERVEDIPVLVEHFLRRFSAEIGKAVRGVTVGALRQLVTYSWPGNVRELEHEVRRMVYLAYPGQAIDSSQLSPEVQASSLEGIPFSKSTHHAGTNTSEVETAGSSTGSSTSSNSTPLPTLDLAKLEKMAIEAALAASGGVLTDAGMRLGISRDALRRRLHRHGLRKGP
jgi:DNA-binding NtrC family response regulator